MLGFQVCTTTPSSGSGFIPNYHCFGPWVQPSWGGHLPQEASAEPGPPCSVYGCQLSRPLQVAVSAGGCEHVCTSVTFALIVLGSVSLFYVCFYSSRSVVIPTLQLKRQRFRGVLKWPAWGHTEESRTRSSCNSQTLDLSSCWSTWRAQ